MTRRGGGGGGGGGGGEEEEEEEGWARLQLQIKLSWNQARQGYDNTVFCHCQDRKVLVLNSF